MKRWSSLASNAGPPPSRRHRGNMVLMTSLVIGIVIFIALLGVGLSFFFASHQKAQSETDSLTLQAAQILNQSDRAGQMNNLISRCRELVYLSRENYTEADSNYRHLE